MTASMTPKPAQEPWTAEWLRRVTTSHWDEPEREVICRLHNAALAAERGTRLSGQSYSKFPIEQEKKIEQLRNQLAAERGHYVRVVEEKAVLVDALKAALEELPRFPRCKNKIDAALAKVREG